MATIHTDFNMVDKLNPIPSSLQTVSVYNARIAELLSPFQQIQDITRLMADALKPPLFDLLQQRTEVHSILSSSLITFAQQQEQLTKTVLPQFSSLIDSVRHLSSSIQPLVLDMQFQQSWMQHMEQLSESFNGIDFDDDTVAEFANMSMEDKQEATLIVSEAVAKSENWEQACMRVFQAAQDRHPILVKAIIFLLSIILSVVVGDEYSHWRETKRQSVLRQEPSSNASTVILIPSGEQIKIIGDAPYYFEVEHNDSKTGKVQIGWLSKRSVQ